MNQIELEKYLWGAATQLRGTIDAGDYKQYIFPLLFFKRICDVYDEEFENALAESDGDIEYATFAEHHHFQVPSGSHGMMLEKLQLMSVWLYKMPCVPLKKLILIHYMEYLGCFLVQQKSSE